MGCQSQGEETMKKILLVSALALSAMTTIALAEPPTLTNSQLDSILAGKRDEVIQTFLGSSNNVCTTNCNVPGRTTETTSLNPGNPLNTTCNNCGTTTTSGPGNN
jgi:hypothetical protein